MSAGLLHLTKHHGLGNDFLVLLDPAPDLDAAALARAVCDRRFGVGADGLLIARPGVDGADVTMELRNADGGRAEMSGNGIRCFAQAVWDAGLSPADRPLLVATDAGLRLVRPVAAPAAPPAGPAPAATIHAAVDMGTVKVGEDAPEWVTGSVQAAVHVDVGNPHLVLLDPDVDQVDVGERGPAIEATFPDGVNIEWIRPGPGPDELTLRVWERGAGATLACGTGSCAAAAAANHWGRVGAQALVHNPGGDVTVELGATAVLIGPAVRVAAVEFSWR